MGIFISGSAIVDKLEKLNFKLVENKELRRLDDYILRYIYSIESAIVQNNLKFSDYDRVGTISTSYYNNFRNCQNFVNQINTKHPNEVGPTTFSATVHNYPLGMACKIFGFKGDSICLDFSDPLPVAISLLKNDTIDNVIISGYDEILEQMTQEWPLEKRRLESNFSTLILTSEKKQENSVEILYNEHFYINNPYNKNISEHLKEIKSKYKEIEQVISSTYNEEIKKIEMTQFKELDTINISNNMSETFGSYTLSSIINSLDYITKKVVLILTCDYIGNYSILVLNNYFREEKE